MKNSSLQIPTKEQYTQLVKQLVNYSIEVTQGDKVWVLLHGSFPDFVKDLFETTIKKAGATPIFDTLTNEEYLQTFEHSSDEEFIEYCKQIEHQLSSCNKSIRLHGIPPESLSLDAATRRGKYYIPVLMKEIIEKTYEKPWVLSKIPTEKDAELDNLEINDVINMFFNMCSLDYFDFKKRCEDLQKLISQKRKVRVIHPNGTDLTFDLIDQRFAFICDAKFNLPDAEIFTGPAKYSVNGTLYINTVSVTPSGTPIRGIKLTFKDGRVTEYSAETNQEALDEIFKNYDSPESDNPFDWSIRYLGEIAFGLNPYATAITGSTLIAEKNYQTMHFALGSTLPESYIGIDGDTSKPGPEDNGIGYHWDLVLDLRDGGVVTIDGKEIMVDGIFKDVEFDGITYNLTPLNYDDLKEPVVDVVNDNESIPISYWGVFFVMLTVLIPAAMLTTIPGIPFRLNCIEAVFLGLIGAGFGTYVLKSLLEKK